LKEVVTRERRRGHKSGGRSSFGAPELRRIGGCHARPLSCAPRFFHGRYSILAPGVASSLLARHGAPPSFVGYGVSLPLVPRWRRRRSLASRALSPLARPPRECHASFPPRGPGVGARSPALGPRRRSPSGSGSHPHRASESRNRHRYSGSRNRRRRYRGPRCLLPPRALGQPSYHTRLSGRHCSCIGVGRQKLSPSALWLIL
jgi:hypothetical protein